MVTLLPVGSWLWTAAAWLKREANAVISGWDDVMEDNILQKQMEYVATWQVRDDTCHSPWCVHSDQAIMWMEASTIATGVVETLQGNMIEDACWFWQDESSHVNMEELDAAVHGINIAIVWGWLSD